MLTPCAQCRRLIPVGQGGYCRGHGPRATRRSSRWTAESRRARRSGLCAWCGARGQLHAHHVEPLVAGREGPLVALCVSCHQEAHR